MKNKFPEKKKGPQHPERHPVAGELCLTTPSGYTVYVPGASVRRHTRSYMAELLIQMPVDVGDRILEELNGSRKTCSTGPR